jgi:hypothetical protein
MYQSSARKNFLDILSDPTAIAILASIALHAAIGATFPFLTPPEKAGTKAGPTTVKIVELTPSELQRIPQAPTPKPVAPPVTKTVPVKRPTAPPPRTPQSATSLPAIPFSPFGNPAATATPKPAKNKQPKPLQKPAQPVFDPNIFTEPKPAKSPVAKVTKPKPVVKPTPAAKPQPQQPKVATSPSPQPDQPMDWNGDGQEPATPATTTPQAQKPNVTPQPSATPTVTPTTQPTAQPTGDPNGNSAGNGFYGKYTDAAINQLQLYMKEFGVKDPYPSKTIVRSYPQGALCGKDKQTPFIVMMTVFDKVPDNVDAAILGNSSASALKISTFKDRDTPEQQKLAEIATRAALEEASKADQNRPAKDKGQRVIYQYRVEFDPATCKKN